VERCCISGSVAGRLFPEAHALREVAAIVGHCHGQAQQVELGAGFVSRPIENGLFPRDFGFYGNLCFFGRGRVAEFQHAAQAARDGAPMFAVVAADAANGTGGDALLRPAAGIERKAQHGLEHFHVGCFAPRHTADFRVDIGGHERRDGGMMTGQANGEIILELFSVVEIGAENILPTRQNSEESVRELRPFRSAFPIPPAACWLGETARCCGPAIAEFPERSISPKPRAAGLEGRTAEDRAAVNRER
jgi:hypothetical protein